MRKGDIKASMLFRHKIKYSDLFEEYLKIITTEGRAEETIKTYKYHNKYFLDFIGEDIFADEVTLQTIQDYIIYLKDEKRYIL